MSKAVLASLFLIITSPLFAGDVALSLEDATKIAKQQIKTDKMPEDHLVIRLIDFAQDKPKFYTVYFDPQIPDPSSDKNNVFIGYHIDMDGTIRRANITVTKSQVKAPFKPEANFSSFKMSASGFLNQPFKLEMSTSKPSSDTAR